MSVVEKVTKLIALASSPNENEARTSASLACKLIREHGLKVVDVNEPEVSPPPAASVPSSDDWYDDVVRRAAEQVWGARAKSSAQGNWSAPPPRRPERPKRSTERRIIVSQFNGRCWNCHKEYGVGEPVAWRPHFSDICLECYDSGVDV